LARIAFILLCHRDPKAIVAQANSLAKAGDFVAVHLDANAAAADFRGMEPALAGNENVLIVKDRVKCGWGEWSLVQASLNALREAAERFVHATHFYLVSGDCMPIKTAEFIRHSLDGDDADHIESVDFFSGDWIKTGMQEERLVYRHFFNERRHKRLFYRALEAQKRLGLKRKTPKGLKIMIGSQWWCLRRTTIEAILEFTRKRRDVVRFFRTTWIPDETFFQTLVRHLVPTAQIRSQSPTFLMFSDYGMPINFHDDHFDLLMGQDFFFARKISPEAYNLKKRLGALYAAKNLDFAISNDGQSIYKYLAGRGRIGQRFGQRFWEREGGFGRDLTLLIVICKKWHVAKRLTEKLRQLTNLIAIDFLFSEDATDLPNLGGIETSVEKRTRHSRAFVGLLFDHFQTDRLLICLDTSNLDRIQDFFVDRPRTRALFVDCEFSDPFLKGHAERVGLASPKSSDETFAALLPAVRNDLFIESENIRNAGFDNFFELRQSAPLSKNAGSLAGFLDISPDRAQEIAQMQELFAD
jgi:hypothetical protein